MSDLSETPQSEWRRHTLKLCNKIGAVKISHPGPGANVNFENETVHTHTIHNTIVMR